MAVLKVIWRLKPDEPSGETKEWLDHERLQVEREIMERGDLIIGHMLPLEEQPKGKLIRFYPTRRAGRGISDHRFRRMVRMLQRDEAPPLGEAFVIELNRE